MEFFEAVKARASVRAFKRCDITDDEMEKIVDAGRRAPSGYNRQPWEFIIVRDPEMIRSLGDIQECIGQASAAIAVVVDEEATQFWKEDASAAIENMLLAATALGFASLWVEGYVLKQEEKGKNILNIPKNLRLLAILPIGKPAETPAQKSKKSLAEIAYLDRYGVSWTP
jgi:nitroreductase